MRWFSDLKKGAESFSNTVATKAGEFKEGAEEWNQERIRKNEAAEERLVNSLLDKDCIEEAQSLENLNTRLRSDFRRAQELSVNLSGIKELHDDLRARLYLPADLIRSIEKRFTENQRRLAEIPAIHGDQKAREHETLLGHKAKLDKLVDERWGSTEPNFGSNLIKSKLAAAGSARKQIWTNNRPLRVAIVRGQACQFELGLYNALMPLYAEMMELFAQQPGIDKKVLEQISKLTNLPTTELAGFSSLCEIPKGQEETYAPIVAYFFYLRRIETYVEYTMLEYLFDIEGKLSESEHARRVGDNSSTLEQALLNFQAAEARVNQHYTGKLDTAGVLNTALREKKLGILALVYTRRPELQSETQKQLEATQQVVKEKQAALQQVNGEISGLRSELIDLAKELIRLDEILSLVDSRRGEVDKLEGKLAPRSDDLPPTPEALDLALTDAKRIRGNYQLTKEALLEWKGEAETNIKEAEELQQQKEREAEALRLQKIKEAEELRQQEKLLKEQRLLELQADIEGTEKSISELSRDIDRQAKILVLIADNIAGLFKKSPYVQAYKDYSEQAKSELPQANSEKLDADQSSEAIEQQLEAAERKLQQCQETRGKLRGLKIGIVDKVAEARLQHAAAKQAKLEAINLEIHETDIKITSLAEELLLNREDLTSQFPRDPAPNHNFDLQEMIEWNSSVDGQLETAELTLDQSQRIHTHLTGLKDEKDRKALEEQQRLQQEKALKEQQRQQQQTRSEKPTDGKKVPVPAFGAKKPGGEKVTVASFGAKQTYEQQVRQQVVLKYETSENKKHFAEKPEYRMKDTKGNRLRSTTSFWKARAWRSGTRDDMVNFIQYITNLKGADNKDLLIYAALLVVKEAIENEDPSYTSVLWCLAKELTEESALKPDAPSEREAKVALSNFWRSQPSGKPKLGKWKIEEDLPEAGKIGVRVPAFGSKTSV